MTKPHHFLQLTLKQNDSNFKILVLSRAVPSYTLCFLSLMMFSLNMVDYPVSFLLLFTWDLFDGQLSRNSVFEDTHKKVGHRF